MQRDPVSALQAVEIFCLFREWLLTRDTGGQEYLIGTLRLSDSTVLYCEVGGVEEKKAICYAF